MRRAWEKRNRNLRRPKSCWMNISAPPPSPSLSWGISQQHSWKDGRGQPCCSPVEILRETAASYAHGTAEYCTPCSLHMMRSYFISIKRRRPHMSRALCWRTFSASLVISGALPATEGTPVAFLLLHLCRHYDWSKFVLICVDSHVIEGSGIDEQKISQRLFSVAICLLPVWFLSINTFE